MYRISMNSIYTKINSLMLKFRDVCHLVVYFTIALLLSVFLYQVEGSVGRDNIVHPGVGGGEG